MINEKSKKYDIQTLIDIFVGFASTVKTHKIILGKFVITSILLVVTVMSFSYLINDFDEMYQIQAILENSSLDSELNQELEDKLQDSVSVLINEIFFACLFSVFDFFAIRNILSEIATKTNSFEVKAEESEVKAEELDKNSHKQKNPLFLIVGYLIVIPSIYILLMVFSGNIINTVNTIVGAPLMRFEEWFFYLMVIFTGVILKQYVGKWHNVSTIEYFKLFGHNYVISERDILEKIKNFSFIILIILVIILYAILFSPNTPNRDNGIEQNHFILFSLIFGMVIVGSMSTWKFREDTNKEFFRQYLAAGYMKKSLNQKSKQKIKLIQQGLQTYSDFFKIHHGQKIENINKITIEIVSKSEKEADLFIQNLIRWLKNPDEYHALTEIAPLMKKKTLSELLVDATSIKEIRQWGQFAGMIVMGIIAFLALYNDWN